MVKIFCFIVLFFSPMTVGAHEFLDGWYIDEANLEKKYNRGLLLTVYQHTTTDNFPRPGPGDMDAKGPIPVRSPLPFRHDAVQTAPELARIIGRVGAYEWRGLIKLEEPGEYTFVNTFQTPVGSVYAFHCISTLSIGGNKNTIVSHGNMHVQNGWPMIEGEIKVIVTERALYEFYLWRSCSDNNNSKGAISAQLDLQYTFNGALKLDPVPARWFFYNNKLGTQ